MAARFQVAARAAQTSSTRTHRSAGPSLEDASRTVLGDAQQRWLDGALGKDAAAWNVIAQNVMMATIAEGTQESPRHYSDAWAGYPPARERLYGALAKHGTANPVVLTGDIHSFWVNDLANAAGKPVGVELVTSSIATSTYDKSAVLPLNPATKFHDGKHNGYVRCELRADSAARGNRRRSMTAQILEASAASWLLSRSTRANRAHDESPPAEGAGTTRRAGSRPRGVQPNPTCARLRVSSCG